MLLSDLTEPQQGYIYILIYLVPTWWPLSIYTCGYSQIILLLQLEENVMVLINFILYLLPLSSDGS